MKQSIERTRKPVEENSTAGGEDRRCKGPREGLGLEDEVRCSLPQPHLRPVQKSSCHLTCLVTVVINGLVGREREDFMMMPGLVPAHLDFLSVRVLSRQGGKYLGFASCTSRSHSTLATRSM